MIADTPAELKSRDRANLELIEAVAVHGGGLVDLWEVSPIRLESNTPNTDEIIDTLFPDNPLLCCGWSRFQFDTRPREQWYKLNDLQFIVPSPMKCRHGLTRVGKWSSHALANTGQRRFLVVECDFEADASVEHARLLAGLEANGQNVLDLCAALLLHLATKAPLALVVHSGGKSLHGWFYCTGVEDSRVDQFCRYAELLGADPANWTRSQFARMPDGMRENGRRQAVLLFQSRGGQMKLAESWGEALTDPVPEKHFHDEVEEADEVEEVKDGCGCVQWQNYVLQRPNTSNKQLHGLAREVRGVEKRRGKRLSPVTYKTIFDTWEAASRPFLRPSVDYFTEFLAKLDCVTVPKGETLIAAFERAKTKSPPEILSNYPNSDLRLFACVCRELQAMAGDEPIMLHQESLAKSFGHPHHRNISNWIKALKVLGLLSLAQNWSLGRAARYYYHEDE